MSLASLPATSLPAMLPDDDEHELYTSATPVLTPTVRLAGQIASGAYQQATARAQRLARELLPRAGCPDDRVRLLYLLAAEETYLAALFPAVNPTTPQRWQAGIAEHQLAGELAGLIATAEEALATAQPYRPGGFDLETRPVAGLMARYAAEPNPVERAGMVDALAGHLSAQGYPPRAVSLARDIAAGLRITAISGHRPPTASPALHSR